MNFYQIRNKTILCCALSWGMGHTTRMAALMKILSGNQNKLIFLGNKKQIQYYEQLIPGHKGIIIPSPEIQYYTGIPLWISILLQMPLLIGMSRSDYNLARYYARKFNADLIISDNRYGFYCPDVPSFMITHQVWPLFPFLRKSLHRWLEKKIYPRFTEIWVPDHEAENKRLSGMLSGARQISNIRFIGWLSIYPFISNENIPTEKYDECWLLSGPTNEQKRFFNDLLKKHLASYENSEKRIVVCGTVPLRLCRKNITFYCSPSPSVIKMLLLESKKIFSRIGYTTLMDAHMLNIMHKMEFTPTPGQSEQEYLYQKHVRQAII